MSSVSDDAIPLTLALSPQGRGNSLIGMAALVVSSVPQGDIVRFSYVDWRRGNRVWKMADYQGKAH